MIKDSKNKLGDFLVELRENYKKMGKVYLSDCGFEPFEMKLPVQAKL